MHRLLLNIFFCQDPKVQPKKPVDEKQPTKVPAKLKKKGAKIEQETGESVKDGSPMKAMKSVKNKEKGTPMKAMKTKKEKPEPKAKPAAKSKPKAAPKRKGKGTQSVEEEQHPKKKKHTEPEEEAEKKTKGKRPNKKEQNEKKGEAEQSKGKQVRKKPSTKIQGEAGGFVLCVSPLWLLSFPTVVIDAGAFQARRAAQWLGILTGTRTAASGPSR